MVRHTGYKPYGSLGQVGIILLLVSVVMLTVGISVVSRSSSDVNISSTNEVANRALDAAESGIENALSIDPATLPNATTLPLPGNPDNITGTTQVAKQNILTATVEQGYVAGIDVSTAGKGAGSPLIISWAKDTIPANQAASLIVSVFSTNSPQVRRFYVGPNGRGDNFSAPSNGADTGYRHRINVTLANGDYLVRIRPMYYTADLRVRGTNLPTQQYVVTSTAQSNVSKETKAVQVERSIPVPPAIFDYVLYSGTSITQ